jgi:hypothetical protein
MQKHINMMLMTCFGELLCTVTPRVLHGAVVGGVVCRRVAGGTVGRVVVGGTAVEVEKAQLHQCLCRRLNCEKKVSKAQGRRSKLPKTGSRRFE